MTRCGARRHLSNQGDAGITGVEANADRSPTSIRALLYAQDGAKLPVTDTLWVDRGRGGIRVQAMSFTSDCFDRSRCRVRASCNAGRSRDSSASTIRSCSSHS